MSSVNWLVEISNSPVEYYALKHTVDSGEAWEERLIGQPSIRKSVSSPTGGFIKLDDTSVTLSNKDGALSAWIAGATDPRGKLIQIYSKAMHDESDVKVLRFAGTITDVTGSNSEQGLSDVTIRASSNAEEFLRSLVPSTTITRKLLVGAAPAGFGVDPDSLDTESVDRVIPVVFGATREHFQGILIERSTDVHDYLVCHDATDVFCRSSINTAYRQDAIAANRIKVILRSEYTEQQVLVEDFPALGVDSSFLVASFNTSQVGPVLFDVECNEFDTSRTNVKRHWLFRENIIDSKNSKVLTAGVPGSQEGEWLFNSDDVSTPPVGPGTGNVGRNDTSGNSRTLSLHSGDDGDNFDGVNDYFLNSVAYPQTRATYKADGGTLPNNAFLIGGSDSFHVAAKVKTQTGFVDLLGGTIVYRYAAVTVPDPEGYRCRISDGYARMELSDSTGTTVVTGTTNLDDGGWHEVVFNLDRSTSLAQIIVDNSLDAEVDITLLGSLTPATIEAPMYVFEGRVAPDDPFFGQCDYIRWHKESYSSIGTYVTGQSEQSNSAISIPSGELFSDADSTDCDIPASTDFMIMSWVKLTDANATIFERVEGGPDDGFRLETSSGKAKISVWDGSLRTLTSSTSINDDKWHQVWMVRESGTLRLYVDGVAEGGTTASTGDVLGGSIDFLAGDIDEFVIEIGNSPGALTAAEIRKQYMNAVGALPRIVQRIIENPTWGLNQATTTQTVDQTSFDDAEDKFFDAARFGDTLNPSHPIYVRVAGAATEQQEAVDLVSELLRMYGGVVRKETAGTWEFKFAWEKVNASSHVLGHLDGINNNVNRISGYRRTNIDEMPKEFGCRYQKFNDPYLQAQQITKDRRYLSRTGMREILADGGLNYKLLDLPYVRDWHSADRVADFVADWMIADEELVVSMSAMANVGNGKVAMDIEPGDVIELTQSQWGLSGKEFRVGEASITNSDEVSLLCYENTTAADTYDEHPDGVITDFVPDDSPDYRYTFPLAPKDLELLIPQTAGDMATYVNVQFKLVGGEINEDILREVEVQWFYDAVLDEGQTSTTDGNEFDVNRIRIPVTLEQVRDGATIRWSTASMNQGRDVTVRVVAISTYGRISSYAQLKDDPQETLLKFRVTTFTGSNRPNSIAGLVHGSANTGIPGAAVVVPLDVSAGATQATGFPGLIPFEPNITAPNKAIIILSNEVLEQDTVNDPPDPGKFRLSGASNNDVEFYRDVEANAESAIGILVPC